MIDKYLLFVKTNAIVFNMFIWHILQKMGIKKSMIIGLFCLVCVSIFFPIGISFLFLGSGINVLHTIVIYLLFFLWSVSIVIFLNPVILEKLTNNLDYIYDMGKLLNISYITFLKSYEKYKYGKHILNDDETMQNKMDKYDYILVNVIYMEIFKMYFSNLNKSINDKKFLYINTQILVDLESDHQINNFYGKIFFNYDNNKNGVENFNKIQIHLMNKVVDVLHNKKWFIDYYKNANMFELLSYTMQTWWKNIVEYSKFPIQNNMMLLSEK